MQTYRLGRLATISLASLLFVACDDDSASGSAGGDGGSSTTAPGGTDPETDADAAGESMTGGATTTTTGGVDTEEPDPTTGPDSATTDVESSGRDSNSSSTTDDSAGVSSGGEDSSGIEESESESESESDSGVIEICEAPGDLTPCDGDTDDPFQAMGLGCVGGPNETIQIFNDLFVSADDTAWRIVSQYGTYLDPSDGLPFWRPREGESMLMLSTGTLPDVDENGVLTQEPGNGGANGNPDGSPLPAPMTAQRGSNGGAGGTPFLGCDGVGDCSDSLLDQWNAGGGDANDLIWFQFQVPVPGGTYGFSFDFAYFSAEFPEWVGSTFNDVFSVWSDSESYTGNLCFVNDQPCTVTALANPQFLSGDPVFEGTLFEESGTEGEGTGWFQAKGSTVPGELLQLTFSLFDMGDTAWDTAVLIDNFQWDCEGCTPSEVDPCIGIDPV